MKKVNTLKGFSKYRRGLIYSLVYDKLVIRVRFDHDKQPSITLEDENGDNTYQIIRRDTMRAFAERKLLYLRSWTPALFIQINTYKVKSKIALSIKEYGKY
jgi:hypothetical protein